MKNTLFMLVAAFMCSFYAVAQTPKIEKSDAFDAPDQGWNKILQLKNGNTFYFHMTKKEGIEATVYDKNRKVIANEVVKSEFLESKKMNRIIIAGLYEINSEPVLFFIQVEGRSPVLYRVRFDPFKGNIAKEEEIGELPKVKMLSTEGSNIIVEKDPLTDCYAVVYFNGSARDRDERIKVVHYNGSHKMINVAYYESPDENFRYLRFIGAVVDGDKRVFIATYGASSLKGRDAHVFIARLNAGDSVFANKTLNFTEDFMETKSVMFYNHTSNMIQLMTVSFASAKTNLMGTRAGYYVSFLSYVDPESMALRGVKPVTTNKVNDYIQNGLNMKATYRGVPQHMVINKDNSVTILSEEITKQITTQNGAVVSAMSILGAVGMSEFDGEGNEKTGYVMLKSQVYAGLVEDLYISNRAKGIWTSGNGAGAFNAYMSFDYVNTDKGRYVLFNDNPKNFERDEDEKRRNAATKVNKLTTICYSVSNGNVNKSFLFGDPEVTKVKSTCLVSSANYMPGTGTYAAVVIEDPEKGDREARIAWITFE